MVENYKNRKLEKYGDIREVYNNGYIFYIHSNIFLRKFGW
jgi:hypothetical protein